MQGLRWKNEKNSRPILERGVTSLDLSVKEREKLVPEFEMKRLLTLAGWCTILDLKICEECHRSAVVQSLS